MHIYYILHNIYVHYEHSDVMDTSSSPKRVHKFEILLFTVYGLRTSFSHCNIIFSIFITSAGIYGTCPQLQSVTVWDACGWGSLNPFQKAPGCQICLYSLAKLHLVPWQCTRIFSVNKASLLLGKHLTLQPSSTFAFRKRHLSHSLVNAHPYCMELVGNCGLGE